MKIQLTVIRTILPLLKTITQFLLKPYKEWLFNIRTNKIILDHERILPVIEPVMLSSGHF